MLFICKEDYLGNMVSSLSELTLHFLSIDFLSMERTTELDLDLDQDSIMLDKLNFL